MNEAFQDLHDSEMTLARLTACVQIRLRKEQEEKERKRKEKAEAHLFTIIKVSPQLWKHRLL